MHSVLHAYRLLLMATEGGKRRELGRKLYPTWEPVALGFKNLPIGKFLSLL
jgi:hypothetical protein